MRDPAIVAEGLAKRFGRLTIVYALRVLSLGGPTATLVWQALAWIGGLLAVSVPAAVLCYRRATTA